MALSQIGRLFNFETVCMRFATVCAMLFHLFVYICATVVYPLCNRFCIRFVMGFTTVLATPFIATFVFVPISRKRVCLRVSMFVSSCVTVFVTAIDNVFVTVRVRHPRQTLISEVLIKAGEVLYVPTQWFHYISNIGINAQCNR